MKVLDLFSGIGGFALGLEAAGFETAAFCEIYPYAQKVLKKNWPGVPIYDDVRRITADRLVSDGVGVDVITGGFPCQDISTAGTEGSAERAVFEARGYQGASDTPLLRDFSNATNTFLHIKSWQQKNKCQAQFQWLDEAPFFTPPGTARRLLRTARMGRVSASSKVTCSTPPEVAAARSLCRSLKTTCLTFPHFQARQ